MNSTVMRMNRPIKLSLFASVFVALISLLIYIPIWQDDAEARRNRAEVHELISIGQDLNEAQSKLKAAGFQLTYDEPIDQTGTGQSVTQRVVIGETQPNAFETIGYAAGIRRMPFTRVESAYVTIRADLDGKITRIKKNLHDKGKLTEH